MKKAVTTLLKAAVSIAILVYLFTKIDLGEVWHLFKQVHVSYLIAALGLYLAGQILCAYRWKVLAGLMDFHNRFREFLLYYFIGMFFNLFLPTSIGGDIGRCYYLAKESKKTLKAIISVLADRGAGLVVLIMIAGLSIVMVEGISIPPPLPAGILTGSTIVLLGLFLPMFAGNYLSKLGDKLGDRLGDKVALLLTYWRKPVPLLKSIGISAIFHSMIVMIHVLIGLSLGLTIPWKFYLFLIPLVVGASMLPISLSGLGVREGAYVYFLSLVNVPRAAALTFSFSWFTIVVLASLTGGVVFLVNSLVRGKR
ncbi:MAG: flippase-like domain-containing protein [Nitrospirae bacterium]|nr:flippase-like domain-containing protein [Nitrospirota bacterium]